MSRLRFNVANTSLFVGREKVIPRRAERFTPGNRLFVLLSDPMLDATEFIRIPHNREVEPGGQVEI